MALNTTRKNFPSFLNRVSFDGQVLNITGKKYLTIVLLALFLIACIGCLSLGLPIFINICVVLSAVFIAYALLDMLFTKSTFTYDVAAKHISLHRKSRRKSVVYKGPVNDFLTVRKVFESPSEGTVGGYFVQLVFDNGEANIPYQLIRWTMPEVEADKKVLEWQARLELN